LSQFRLLLGLAAAAFACAVSAQSSAFCLTHTCDFKKENCEIVDGCNVSGKTLFWASSVVTWDVQKDDSLKRGITSVELEEVATRAFTQWQNVDCPGGGHPSISLLDKGPIACGKAEYNQAQPNANVITFHDGTWPYGADSAIETLALTTVFFNGETGEIYDANVEVNTNQADFALVNPHYPAVNLNAVLTHELGHFLGLSHSSNGDATMFSSYMAGMDTLEADDVAAICASLPPGRSTKNTSAPRHGFSGECCTGDCSGVTSGCCATAVGGNVPASNVLGLWAFGLGLCAWGARARFKRRE